MTPAARAGLATLAAGAVLGVLGDVLLRELPIGLNATLWGLVLLAAALLLGRVLARPRPYRRWALALAGLFLVFLSWRASPWLVALNAVAACGGVALCLAPPGLARLSLSAHFRTWLEGVAGVAAGGFGAASRVDWRELARRASPERVAPVLRGLAIALPLLVLFGALLAAADAVFGELLGGVVPDVGTTLDHVLVAAVFGWLAAGLLQTLLMNDVLEDWPEGERTLALGRTEVTTVLILLNLLFLTFVGVQLGTYFGGDDFVQREIGLTYAEYAREGFFELVAVAALLVPLVLALDWLRRGAPGPDYLVRSLSATLVALLGVVIVSALQRMRLYQQEFGLTELRVYTTAFMLWLAAVALWLGFTVLSQRRELFAVGALGSAFVALATLNVVNPDALIARTNIERAEEAKEIDISYLTELSDDAVPVLARELGRLPVRTDPTGAYRRAALELLGRSEEKRDWRSWSWSRRGADAAIEEHRAALKRLAEPG